MATQRQKHKEGMMCWWSVIVVEGMSVVMQAMQLRMGILLHYFNMHSHILYRRDFASLNAKSFLYIDEWHHLNSVGIHCHRLPYIQEICCVAIRKIIPLYIGMILCCYAQNLSSFI